MLKELRQITVVGLGLLGASITLAVLRTLSGVKTVGYSHRAITRRKARDLGVADEIVDDMAQSVAKADIVILATPIRTFEEIFRQIGPALPKGCIVTDVGSTKVLPHRWARKVLPGTVYYVGSHPIAGSEQRGIEFSRDDLLDGANCILTSTKRTNRGAMKVLEKFWTSLGCSVIHTAPARHDRILADISHLPHIVATALVNANSIDNLKFAGRGFIDTSRLASGPANVWADILLTNANNTDRSIEKLIKELGKLQKAISSGNQAQIKKLLEQAGKKRAEMINYKIKKREVIS